MRDRNSPSALRNRGLLRKRIDAAVAEWKRTNEAWVLPDTAKIPMDTWIVCDLPRGINIDGLCCYPHNGNEIVLISEWDKRMRQRK